MATLPKEHISTRKPSPSSWLPWFTSLGVLAITIVFSWNAEQAERSRGRLQFDGYVDHAVEAVHRRLDSYSYFLEAIHVYLGSHTEISGSNFYEYVDHLNILEKLPALQAVGFAARASMENAPEMGARVAREGVSDFRIFPDPTSYPAAPIIYSYPQTTLNQRSLGYNLMAEASTRLAIERATREHTSIASGSFEAIQDIEITNGPIFFLVYPAYTSETARTDTLSDPVGWIFIILRTDALMQSLSDGALEPVLDYTVYDGSSAGSPTLIYNSSMASRTQSGGHVPMYSTTQALKVAGRTWTLRFTSRPEFELLTQHFDAVRNLLLGTGLALILLITAQVASAGHRRVLRQREWLRVTLESIGDAVIATDAQRRVLFLNPSAEALTGWSQNDAIGRPSEDVVRVMEPGSSAPIEDIAAQALRKGSSLELFKDLYIERRNGTLVPIQDSASPIRDVTGKTCGTILVFHDISNRKRTERLENASARVIRILAYARALDQAAPELISEISAGLQSDAGALWTFGESGDCLLLRASTGLRREDYEFAWETTNLEQPFWLDLNDTPATPMVSSLAAAGYKTAIGIPILTRGEPKGALTFLSRNVLPCHPETMYWLSSLGLQIGHLAELRQEDTRRQAIIEGAFDSIISFDPQGAIIDANEAAQQMFHRTREEMQRCQIDKLIEVPDLLVLHRSPPTPESRANRFLNGSIRAANGEATPIELTVSQVTLEGEVLYTAFIRHLRPDISDLGVRGAILNYLTEGVLLADEHGTIIFSNQGLERMLDYDHGELIGKTAAMLFEQPPGTLPPLICTPNAESLGAEHFFGELSCRKKDGSVIITLTQASLITFSGTKYLFTVQTDITETRKWESALIQSEHRFRTMANNLPVLIWLSDHNQHITWLNTSLFEFCGLSADDTLDKLFLECIDPEDRSSYVQEKEAAIRELRDFEIEYRLRRFDGTYRWIWERGSPLYETEYTLTGYLGSGIDITDRKQTEQDRAKLLTAERAARSQFEKANQIKDEFLATLSHELRTPLNSILGWTHILRKDPSNAERLKLGIEIIEKNAKAQAQMIGDLLDMSRILSGKVRIEAKPTDLAQVISSAIETIAPTAQSKGIDIHFHADAGLGIVHVDPHRLHQVLLNLLSNAVRFSKANASIDVTVIPSDTEVSISVRDYGGGIAAEFLPHVFDRFRQADSSTTRRHGGLGLGLSIVKHLVELHGGHVHAESAGTGHGATFTITLPRSVASLTRSAIEGTPSTVMAQPESKTHRTLEGVRVLAVDDEQDTRDLLKVLLEDEGAAVTTAASAKGAFASICETPPDLVISDISMPDEDGYEFMQKLRVFEADQGGLIPAIALTALARPEDRDQALAAGFQAHLAKPLNPAALVQTVVELVSEA
jgi:PAS domain S-box-containing protein